MSRKRFMKALNCENPDVIPHRIWLLHPEFIKDATGVDYYEHPRKASLLFHERFDVDSGGPAFVNDAPISRPKPGISENGAKRTDEAFETEWHTETPFREPEDLWNFDPDPFGPDAGKAVDPKWALKNYRWCYQPEKWKSLRDPAIDDWKKREKLFPGKFTNGDGFYCTSFMWGICIFGWDILLAALGENPDKTGETLRRISAVTEKVYEFFASNPHTDYVWPHDDICIKNGPVMSPEWYRKYIFPEYERIFEPVKKAGKKVIFTSDGDIRALSGDIANVADAIVFESSTPSDFMFEKFGRDKCLIGGIDVRPLTLGTPKDTETEVRKAIERGRDCPGFVIACADSIPGNVPLENVYVYFDTVEKNRYRK